MSPTAFCFFFSCAHAKIFACSILRRSKSLRVRSFAPKQAQDRGGAERQAEAYFQQGLALEETGAPIEKAVEAYSRAVELNPSAAGALVNLGTIYYRQRKYEEAERHYERAIAV